MGYARARKAMYKIISGHPEEFKDKTMTSKIPVHFTNPATEPS